MGGREGWKGKDRTSTKTLRKVGSKFLGNNKNKRKSSKSIYLFFSPFKGLVQNGMPLVDIGG